MIIYQNKKYTPNKIDHKTLGENDIFVFGSNTQGKQLYLIYNLCHIKELLKNYLYQILY